MNHNHRVNHSDKRENPKYREYKEKIERIRELQEEGFNVPRFIYLEKNSNLREVDEALSWAKDINDKSSDQIFNIRTYDYSKISEQETNS